MRFSFIVFVVALFAVSVFAAGKKHHGDKRSVAKDAHHAHAVEKRGYGGDYGGGYHRGYHDGGFEDGVHFGFGFGFPFGYHEHGYGGYGREHDYY